MNILVIGNGFDIAHGLPTKYSDFIEFVGGLKKYKLNEKSKYSSYFDTLKKEKPLIYQEIDDLVKDNRWINYFMITYGKIKDDCARKEMLINSEIVKRSTGKDGWIDFEREISKVIRTLDEIRLSTSDQFKSGSQTAEMTQWQFDILEYAIYTSLDPKLKGRHITPDSIDIWKEQLLTDLNRLTRCLEIYLCDYLPIDKCKALCDIAELQIDKILSFNYIDTYGAIYSKNSHTIDYDFIHGKADINNDISTCNLVLGIDEYLSEDAKNEDNEFIQFKKFYQRIYKMTGCHYMDWLDDRFDKNGSVPLDLEELNIYIYGHSLDATDGDILRRLIREYGAQTTIFYHNKKALGDQIANLVKVIGEEELIKRTDGRYATIIFKQTSKETVELQTTNT